MGERLFIESLEPRTKERCLEHKHRAKLEGIETLVVAGARTWQEQLAEYEKGRKRSSRGWLVADPRQVVTLALPDHAPHVRRAAYDLYPVDRGVLCTMDATIFDRDQIEKQLIRFWLPLVRIGHELGLVCGADWPRLRDYPHFERSDWRTLPEPEPVGLEDMA